MNNSSTSSSEFVSLKLYDKLIAELRCPGCSMAMKFPIRLCKTGHSVCDDCVKMIDSCPLCKEEFTLTRNLTLEALCSKAEFPCENLMHGCRVRLTTPLLDWHEKQCAYRIVKCFIGKVWGKCEWKGCEKDWLEHINKMHLDKVFTLNPTELKFHIKNYDLIKPLSAYYIFQMYDHVFSFYQIFDKINRRILWTMSYEPKGDKIRNVNSRGGAVGIGANGGGAAIMKMKFAFEIEIYDARDSFTKAIIQRYECHRNGDKDILRDGACATLSMGDGLRFVDDNKVLHYRVRIHKINNAKEKILINSINSNKDVKKLPIDYQQTIIEGVNHKQVPSNLIITRKIDVLNQLPIKEATNNIVTNNISGNNDGASGGNSNYKNSSTGSVESIIKFASDSDSYDSESDPELEEFVNNLFKTKFAMNSNLKQQSTRDNQLKSITKISVNSTMMNMMNRRKQNLFRSFSESCKGIKTSFIELKTIGGGKKKTEKDDNSMEDNAHSSYVEL